MNTPFVSIALCACVLSLGACDKTKAPPPTPTVNEGTSTGSPATTSPAFDPSMPAAVSGSPQASASPADTTPGRPDGTRSPAQESLRTPIPGQNNDHSAPTSPATPASAP